MTTPKLDSLTKGNKQQEKMQSNTMSIHLP